MGKVPAGINGFTGLKQAYKFGDVDKTLAANFYVGNGVGFYPAANRIF